MTETTYPLSNIRWTYALAFFVLPPMLVGYDEGGLDLALVGAVVGLSFVAYVSVLDWSGETDHWIGDYIFASIIVGLAFLVVSVLGLFVYELFGFLGLFGAWMGAYLSIAYVVGRWLL